MSEQANISQPDAESPQPEAGPQPRRRFSLSRRWLFLALIPVAGVAAVGAYVALMPDRGPPLESQLLPSNVPARDPVEPVSPEYGRSLETRDVERSEEARQGGGSFLPEPYGQADEPPAAADPAPVSNWQIPEGVLPGPEETLPELDPVQDETAPVAAEALELRPEPETESVERDFVETERLPLGETVSLPREDLYGDYDSEPIGGAPATADLSGAVEALIESWARPPDYVLAKRRQQEQDPAEDSGAPDPETPGARALLPAGADLYAVLRYEVSSDAAAPVVAEILEPPLQGAVAIGDFEEAGAGLALRFHRVTHRDVDYEIEAWGVGPDCDCMRLEGETDRHWWSRVILPTAVSFAAGYLRAAAAPPVRVTINEGTVVERSASTTRQQLYGAGAEAITTAGRMLGEDAPRRTTLRLPAGTELGLAFVAPVIRRQGSAR